MKKLIGTVLMAGLLVAPTFADEVKPADAWVGVVDARGSYQVVMASNETRSGEGRLSRLQVGDRVIASAEPVSIRLSETGTILVGSNSEVLLKGTRTVELQQGTVATGFPADKPMAVQFDTIEVTLAKALNDATDEATIVPTSTTPRSVVLAAERLTPTSLRLSALNEAAIVRDIKSGTQIAVIGANDALEFVKNEAGNWVIATRDFFAPAMQQDPAGAGTGTGTGQGSGGGSGTGGGGGGMGTAAGIGGGLVGVGVGGYALKKNNDNEDDIDDLKDEIDDLEDENEELEDIIRSLIAP